MQRRAFNRGLLGALAVAAAARPADAALRSVAINYGVPQIPVSTAAIFSIPRRLGLWAKEGLDVATEGAQGAGPGLQQLIAGQVMLTFTGLPAAMELINKGAPIRIVASVYNSNVFYPVVLATSPVRDIPDLKGKTIGVTGVASTNAQWIKAILKSYGISGDDIHLVGTGDGASAISALVHGQVDALQLVEADYDRYEAAGVALRRLNTAPILQKLSFVQGLIASQRTIADDPSLITGLLRGIAEAAFYSQAHVEDAVRMHWAEFPETRLLGGDQAKALRDAATVLRNQLGHYTSPTTGGFGAASPASVAYTRDALFDLGQLSKKLPTEDYFTDRFIGPANDFDHAAILALPPNL
jgi:NitT/TauT family transport system substrate-binding protein